MLQDPRIQRFIRQLKDAGMDIDETDEQQVFQVLQALQEQAREANEVVPDQKLATLDIEGIGKHIQESGAQKIIVMVGAGLSTAAGIPDFRTPGSGLYDNLQKYDLPTPEAIFTLDYFRDRPGAFYELAREMWPGNFMPTRAHFFIRLLEEKGLLLRCYTQNIDMLEELAGVSKELIVAAHGNFSTASTVDSQKPVPMEEVKDAVMQGEEGWKAMKEKHGELVKPDIVFFGEGLPDRFMNLIERDFPACDLLIVMGTSLVVAPFCTCIEFVGKECPRLLINREPAGTEMRDGFRIGDSRRKNYRDAFFRGNCDAGVDKLCELLGWSEDLDKLVAAASSRASDEQEEELVGKMSKLTTAD